MEARTNIINIFKLPVKYDMIVETNWNNNSKPASKTPSKIPSKKPSAKQAGSSKAGPSSSKVAASKSGTASKPAASSLKPAGSSSRPAAGSPSRPTSESSIKESSIKESPTKESPIKESPTKSASGGQPKRGGSSKGETSHKKEKPSKVASAAKSKSPSLEQLSDHKIPSAIASDAGMVKSKETQLQQEKLADEKRAERKRLEEKRTEDKLTDDNGRRLTFCRRKERKSIVLSGCAPQATAYFQVVEKVFKEKDFASERNTRSTCAGNCKKMLIPKEVPAERKKSDEFAKRLSAGGICRDKDKSKEYMD